MAKRGVFPVAVALVLAGCTSWQPIQVNDPALAATLKPSRRVRLISHEAKETELEVTRLAWPLVEGREQGSDAVGTFDLRSVRAVEVQRVDNGKVLAGAGGVVLVGALVGFVLSVVLLGRANVTIR